MSKAKKIISISIFAITALAAAKFALAAAPDLGLNYVASTGLGAQDPRVIIDNIIRVALGFLGVIAIALIIYGGYLWMTANGNEERIAAAKKVLISAVIGLLIILSAFGIATFILNSLLRVTGVGSGEGGPCSSSASSCQPSDGLCLVGKCGADCLCHSNITPPAVIPPGGTCSSGPF
ncbi:MAG TPA: pilin, partial [Candidatus Nanoarchaeia archaeon]|nr:pilin [Candidatus Nanoarchaeia archaeon]